MRHLFGRTERQHLQVAHDIPDVTTEIFDDGKVVKILPPDRVMTELREVNNLTVELEAELSRANERKRRLQSMLIEVMKDYGIRGEIAS